MQRDFGPLLRQIRQACGLSLMNVEEKSGERWRAVVVGSYERRDRDPTIYRSSDLLEFYHHRLEVLAPGDLVVRAGRASADAGSVAYSVVSPAGDEIHCGSYGEAQRMLKIVAGSRLGQRITGPLTMVDGAP